MKLFVGLAVLLPLAASSSTIRLPCPWSAPGCRKCPSARPNPFFKSLPHPVSSSRPNPTLVAEPPLQLLTRPHIMLPQPGEPAALTGPQFENPEPMVVEAGAQSSCKLTRCGGKRPCGAGASCMKGYCSCASGFKGAKGSMGRGWDVPEASIVFVNAETACDVQCSSRFCDEVGGLEGCFGGVHGETGWMEGHNEVDTGTLTRHGAIQVPKSGEDSVVGVV